MKHWLIMVFIALLTATAMTACIDDVAYNHYEHTPLSGWEKNDTLFFYTHPIAKPGRYHAYIGLRTTVEFPFTSLNLLVEQRTIPGNKKKTHTLKCKLMEKNGNINGQGVSFFQYEFPLAVLELHQGDSLQFFIRHDMKREILPGIADVGLKLTRK